MKNDDYRRTIKKRYVAATVAVVATAAVLPTLIGGRIAEEGQYPAIVRITSNNGAGCTAAIIGPNALLTAAHCVEDGGYVKFKHSGTQYKSRSCSHHDTYESNNTHDFALCPVDKVAEPWISINTDHKLTSMSDEVVLTGYGCVKKGGGGGNDGLLRIGSAKVIKLPAKQNFDIVTKAATALCFGDSGGPAFKGNVLIGVNSRGNIEDTSYVSAIHMADESFVKPWAERHEAKICGLTSKCNGAEEQQPEPEPGPESQSLWMTFLFWIIDLIFSK